MMVLAAVLVAIALVKIIVKRIVFLKIVNFCFCALQLVEELVEVVELDSALM